jgi:hypothetical protein
MQFEGHSTAVADIVVDAVGKYAYTISSPHTEELPVIMDVALEERTKVTLREMAYQGMMWSTCNILRMILYECANPNPGLPCCRC